MARQLLLMVLCMVFIKKSDGKCDNIIDMSNATITGDLEKADLFDNKYDDLSTVASLSSIKPFCLTPRVGFYFEIDFDRPVVLTSLKMKGYFVDVPSLETVGNGITLQFSFDKQKWYKYNEVTAVQQYFLVRFSDRDDGNAYNKIPLKNPVFTQYMRIYLTSTSHTQFKQCLRFEVRGCDRELLPRVDTQPVVESTSLNGNKLECTGYGMVGLSVWWSNLTATTTAPASGDVLMTETKSVLPLDLTLDDVLSWPSCRMQATYFECSRNYTCFGSYAFNENSTAETSTLFKVRVDYPSPPSKLFVEKKSKDGVVVAWEPPARNGLPEDVLEHVLYCNTTENATSELLPMSIKRRSLTGLAVYSRYKCTLKIQLKNESKDRLPFDFDQRPVVLDFKSRAAVPKVKPELTAVAASPTSIKTTFSVKFDREEYGDVRGFYIVATMLSYRGVTAIALSKIPLSKMIIKKRIEDPRATSYVMTGVKPWSKYTVSIQAYNQDDLYTNNNTKIVDTPEGIPSQGPRLDTRTTGKYHAVLEVHFDSSFKNGVIKWYTIKIDGLNRTKEYPATKGMVLLNVNKLHPYHKYMISCKASTIAGYGPYGEKIEVDTKEDIPSMPVNVQTVHVEDTNSLLLRWFEPTQPNGKIKKYQVRLSLKNGTSFTRLVDPDATKMFQFNVSKHDVRQVEVRAETKGGWGPYSSPIFPGIDKPAKSDNESLNDVILVVAFTAAVVFLLILVVLCILHHRKRRHPILIKDPTTEPIFPRQSTTSAGPDDDDDYNVELVPWPARRGVSDSVGTGSQSIINNTLDPVPVEEFSEYMEEAKNGEYEVLVEQFESIPSGKCSPWQAAELPENKPKNRYTNVAAYDSSRVILKCDSKRKGSDYINASTIHGYNHEEKKGYKYISTQGPLSHTENDFWHMIWQEEVTIIVMLTNLQENDKIKCSQYWPHEQNTVYGNVSVTLDKIDKTADYVTRTFQVELLSTKEVRTVLQFHFVSWPDHGVPDYPTAILSLRRRVRHCYDESKPMVVHCSAGIGRSGCFILIDAMLERIDKEKSVDVFNYLKYMRTRRINMVQTSQQYRFAHMAILEYVTFGNTEIFVGELDKKIRQLGKNNGFENEFSLLTRNTTEQVGNMYQVLLREGRFIDAYHVDGYKQRDAFILTKASTESNVGDFWKMVLEKQCHTIVMLNKSQETTQSYFKYWPDVDSHYVYGDITVLTATEVANGNIITRKIKVTTNKRRCEVHHFQYVDWPDSDVPHRRGYSNICTLMQAVEKSQQNLGNGPIIVHEGNGYGRSGSFIAIYNSTERLKVEQLIDVLQCVRAIRIAQPLAVDNITQYQFVYNMLRTYLEGFENYWNYKDYKVTRSPLGSTSTN